MTTRNGSLWIVAAAMVAAPLFGCAGQVTQGDGSSANDNAALTSLPNTVRVDGHYVDVESTYLPRVVMCENGNAPLESLKAQAIASRTYLAYRTAGETTPTISDGQSDQVYTCALNHYGAYVSDDVKAAVAATAGQIINWNGKFTAGFFVAGDERVSSNCRRAGSTTSTEKYVTYNLGNVGDAVTRSSIGDRSQSLDRGAMAQNLANCLAETNGYTYDVLLRYFYGSDIVIGPVGSPAMDDSDAATQSQADALEGTCFSQAWARLVPLNGCIQSGASGGWYQCNSDGTLQSIPTDDSGNPVGNVACATTDAH